MKYLLLICAMLILLLAACAPTSEPAPEPVADVEPVSEPELVPEAESLDRSVDPALYVAPLLYERGGLVIAIPNKYADKLLIDPPLPEEPEQWYIESGQDKPLIYVYQKASFESKEYPGAGFLFSIWRYSQAQYEKFLTYAEGSGQSFFARDDNWYYGFFFATDVQPVTEYEEYRELEIKVGDFVKEDMIKRNGLQPYSMEEFWSREYTYDGEHLFLRYYPYAALNGKRDVVWTLVLSQPVKQGAGGIWCVERWFEGLDMSQAPYIYSYFPDMGKPAAEYYAELQAACGEGHNTAWLDPYQVGLEFANTYYGHDRATLESFELDDEPK